MKTNNELVSARNFKIGFIYGGAPVGEFQPVKMTIAAHWQTEEFYSLGSTRGNIKCEDRTLQDFDLGKAMAKEES
jgi:hypothetical protein